MQEDELDTPTDRLATFALLATLIETSTDPEVTSELERLRELISDLLEGEAGAESLIKEELSVAD